MHGLNKMVDKLAARLLLAITILSVSSLGLIFIFLAKTGLTTFLRLSWLDFFGGTVWNPTAYLEPRFGILALVMGTILVSLIALTVVFPIGLIVAIYLSELAKKKEREIVKPLVEMIACIPSVVIGVIGLTVIAPVIANFFSLSNGLNALTAGILVAVTALPFVATLVEDALFNVKDSLREASLALGANQWTTIWRVVIPAALSGLVAALMLGLSRIIGETMIVLMVAGNSRAFPKSIFSAVSPMTATIAVDIKEVVTGSLHYQSLFAIGLVLFFATFILNLLADLFIRHEK